MPSIPIFLVLFGLGCLILRVGFALQMSGSLRCKNSGGSILRVIADTAAAGLAFWAVGAGILFQNRNRGIGFDTRFLFSQPPDWACAEFFHLTLCLIGGAVVAGAIAERAKFYAGVAASAVLGGVVFPITGHWIWFGMLREWGFIDVGGATAIHLSAAIFAAVGVAILGSRRGKYTREGSSNAIPGHSLPSLGIGVLLLFIGWFPYLLGCVAAHWSSYREPLDEIAFGISAGNIFLAGVSGLAGGLICSHFHRRTPDLYFSYSGMLGALVAISPGVLAVTSVGAVLIGTVAGILVPLFSLWLDRKAHLDDPVGLVAINGAGAIWGTLATSLLVTTTRPTDHLRLLAIQSGGLAIVIVFSLAVAAVMFLGLKKMQLLRAVQADEDAGMDICEHNVNPVDSSCRISLSDEPEQVAEHRTPA